MLTHDPKSNGYWGARPNATVYTFDGAPYIGPLAKYTAQWGIGTGRQPCRRDRCADGNGEVRPCSRGQRRLPARHLQHPSERTVRKMTINAQTLGAWFLRIVSIAAVAIAAIPATLTCAQLPGPSWLWQSVAGAHHSWPSVSPLRERSLDWYPGAACSCAADAALIVCWRARTGTQSEPWPASSRWCS